MFWLNVTVGNGEIDLGLSQSGMIPDNYPFSQAETAHLGISLHGRFRQAGRPSSEKRWWFYSTLHTTIYFFNMNNASIPKVVKQFGVRPGCVLKLHLAKIARGENGKLVINSGLYPGYGWLTDASKYMGFVDTQGQAHWKAIPEPP